MNRNSTDGISGKFGSVGPSNQNSVKVLHQRAWMATGIEVLKWKEAWPEETIHV